MTHKSGIQKSTGVRNNSNAARTSGEHVRTALQRANGLLSALRRDFAAFDPIRSFEAAMPVYVLRLTIEVLEPQKLGSFETYMLQAVRLGVGTQTEIARMLGVETRDLVAPGATLLRAGLIEQGAATPEGERYITLTDIGRRAIEEQIAPSIPKVKQFKLHYNAVSGHVSPLDGEAWPVERMLKEGLFVLPVPSAERPSLGALDEHDVEMALHETGGFPGHTLIALLDLKEPVPEFLAPIWVFLLQAREGDEQQIAVYRHGMLQRAESTTLQQLFDEGRFSLPEDASLLERPHIEIPRSLPAPLAQATYRLVQNERAVSELLAVTEVEEERRETTQDDGERATLEERILELKEEVRIKRADAEVLRGQLREKSVEFLRTEEHRAVLERALREARHEILIISPWMNRNACDDLLCSLFGQALERGVRIRIGYGMGRERDPAEANRNRSNVQAVRGAILRVTPRSSHNLLEMRATAGTHQKILVCDEIFAVTGSFNWLSYAGRIDEGYRAETGVLFCHMDQVREVKSIAEAALGSESA